ncbi:Uncharacterised protein [Mycobacteroides abscessus subsp. abscessus]|nr:Uncharacterised protein [Mycobacteroides abscessus subsp. abscessus]
MIPRGEAGYATAEVGSAARTEVGVVLLGRRRRFDRREAEVAGVRHRGGGVVRLGLPHLFDRVVSQPDVRAVHQVAVGEAVDRRPQIGDGLAVPAFGHGHALGAEQPVGQRVGVDDDVGCRLFVTRGRDEPALPVRLPVQRRHIVGVVIDQHDVVDPGLVQPNRRREGTRAGDHDRDVVVGDGLVHRWSAAFRSV